MLKVTGLAARPDVPTVLLVDHDGAVRRMMARFLEMEGFAIVEASNGQEALAHVRTGCGTREIVVMSLLTNPVVNLDFYQIANRGRKLPVGAEDFTSFLKSYIARWAGRAGVL